MKQTNTKAQPSPQATFRCSARETGRRVVSTRRDWGQRHDPQPRASLRRACAQLILRKRAQREAKQSRLSGELPSVTHLPASHTVEEILLGSDAGQEAPVHEAAGSRARVVRQERRQRPTAGHEGRPSALQLNLAQQARDLHTVDGRALGA